MDDLLEKGETVVYRGKPGWRTAAIATACGLSIAAAIHMVVGVWDDNWTCPASLLWLMLMTPFGIVMIVRTAGARLIVTDRRILYRPGPFASVEQSALGDIDAAESSAEILLPVVTVSRRDGDDITVRFLARPEEVCHHICPAGGQAPNSPRTLRGAVLIVAAFGGASFGLLSGMAGFGTLLLNEPTGALDAFREWHLGSTYPVRLLGYCALVGGTYGLLGPIYLAAGLGAWIGYLPALFASRILITFEEAKHLAQAPRWVAPVLSASQNNRPLHKWIESDLPSPLAWIIVGWPAFWLGLVIRFCARNTDWLAGILFRHPVTPDNPQTADSREPRAAFER